MTNVSADDGQTMLQRRFDGRFAWQTGLQDSGIRAPLTMAEKEVNLVPRWRSQHQPR
jgi:hypothetical protein